jgi:hypothetical protein
VNNAINDVMELIFGRAEMDLMCAIRRVFNPRGLANPSKILPLHVCREWAGPGTRVLETTPAAAPRKILDAKFGALNGARRGFGVNRCCAALEPWLTSNSYVRKV